MTPVRRSRSEKGWNSTPSTRIMRVTRTFSPRSGRTLSVFTSSRRYVEARTRSPGRTKLWRCHRSSAFSTRSLISPVFGSRWSTRMPRRRWSRILFLRIATRSSVNMFLRHAALRGASPEGLDFAECHGDLRHGHDSTEAAELRRKLGRNRPWHHEHRLTNPHDLRPVDVWRRGVAACVFPPEDEMRHMGSRRAVDRRYVVRKQDQRCRCLFVG